MINEDERIYFAPGLQFGARSQELSLTLASADVFSGRFSFRPAPFEDSRSFGLRLNVVATDWSPVAVSTYTPRGEAPSRFGRDRIQLVPGRAHRPAGENEATDQPNL